MDVYLEEVGTKEAAFFGNTECVPRAGEYVFTNRGTRQWLKVVQVRYRDGAAWLAVQIVPDDEVL